MLAQGTKKIAICQRRLGTRDRMVQIALCTNETMADRIVQGLHLRQKQIVKIETPKWWLSGSQKTARSILRKAEAVRIRLRAEEAKSRDLQCRLDSAIRERDAAQKAARETA